MSGKNIQFIVFLILYAGSFISKNEVKAQNVTEFPDTKFIVLSDPHYYDPSLGMEGEAFEQYLDNDRKLLRESTEILGEARKLILASDAEFLVIPGDLTKDGTRISHLRFASVLEEIEKTGKKVFVVPGNHDILNPESFSYRDSLKILVDNITPGEFAKIYSNFGYNEAIARDPASLSYIVEPVKGLWIFCLDACRYDENQPGGHPVTGGKFRDISLEWISGQLDSARASGKAVLGMMHHGILEHYKKQSHYFEDYVVDDFKKVSRLFAEKGMKMVFTGHYHAQDIVRQDFGKGNVLYDIETGSLVTFPCPVREVRIKDNTVDIATTRIGQIQSRDAGFPQYAREFVWSGIQGIAHKALISYKLQEEEAALLSGQVADAFLAHYQGDEVDREKPFDLAGVSLKGRLLISFKKKLVWNLWNDLEPADNDLQISF